MGAPIFFVKKSETILEAVVIHARGDRSQPEMLAREIGKGGNNVKCKTVTKLLREKHLSLARIFCCQMQNRFEDENYLSCAV